MKKVWLVCLALLLMQGVCFAKIEKQVDDLTGRYCYFVDYLYTDINISGYVGASFVVYFNNDGSTTGNGLEVSIRNDESYFIEDTIKCRIDDTIYTWKTEVDSQRGNGSVRRSFTIPSNVYNALMKTQNNIAIRFFYHALSGDYKKDFVIPYKSVKEAQKMFTMYVPKDTSPAQAAN